MEKPEQKTIAPASLGLRLVNYLIDTFLSRLFSFSFLLFIIFAPAIAGLNIVEPLLATSLSTVITSIVLYSLGRFSYYVVFEYFFSKTPGKFITKTSVKSYSGDPTTKQLHIRSLARFIPFNEFSAFSSSGRTWHDQLSRTIVVRGERGKYTKKNSLAVIVLGILLISTLLSVIAVTGYTIKELDSLKLGALEAPTELPRDVKAIELTEIEEDTTPYYEIQYSGSDTKFKYIEFTAGYHFNPRNSCIYNISTNAELGYDEIADGLSCTMIEEFDGVNDISLTVKVYKIEAGEDFPESELHKVPEYYIAIAPQRYVIEVQEGSLSDEEVVNMARSLRLLYPEEIVDN